MDVDTDPFFPVHLPFPTRDTQRMMNEARLRKCWLDWRKTKKQINNACSLASRSRGRLLINWPCLGPCVWSSNPSINTAIRGELFVTFYRVSLSFLFIYIFCYFLSFLLFCSFYCSVFPSYFIVVLFPLSVFFSIYLALSLSVSFSYLFLLAISTLLLSLSTSLYYLVIFLLSACIL